MATCLLTSGRSIQCRDNVGGLYKIFFANWNTLTGSTMTISADNQISGLTATVYEYNLKGTSNLTQDMVADAAAGTIVVNQTLVVDLQKVDYKTNNEIKLLASQPVHAFVQGNDGKTYLVGKDFGLTLTSGQAVSGSALGEKNGYTLTFTGMELSYANLVSDSTLANPFGSNAVTIVKGS